MTQPEPVDVPRQLRLVLQQVTSAIAEDPDSDRLRAIRYRLDEITAAVGEPAARELTRRDIYLERYSQLALHLVSGHGCTAHALTDDLGKLAADHRHEHAGPGTIRNHPASDLFFDEHKVAASIRDHDRDMSALPAELEALEYRLALHGVKQGIREALRDARVTVQAIDAYGQHGEILRGDVLDVLTAVAVRKGVTL